MGAKSAEEILGLEFDWLASDADNHVALFSTAGGGYAPEAFLGDTDAHDDAIFAILALPASTVAVFSPELAPGLKNTWRMVAERGIFAFDSDANGGPYRVVAAPAVPAKRSELPAAVADALRALKFGHIRFSDLSFISSALLQRSR